MRIMNKILIVAFFCIILLCGCNEKNKKPADESAISSETENIANTRNRNRDFMDADHIVCFAEYIAYITKENQIYLKMADGSGKILSGFEGITALFGTDFELTALDKNGILRMYSISKGKMITEFPSAEELVIDSANYGPTLGKKADIKKSLSGFAGLKSINMEYLDWYIGILQDGHLIYDGISMSDHVVSTFASWENIEKYESDGVDVIGLKKDGTVLYATSKENLHIMQTVTKWSGIIDVDFGLNVFGLKLDGSVVTYGLENLHVVTNWRNIVQISDSGNTVVGLEKDGTVHVACKIDYGQKAAEEWTDISLIKASNDYIMGIKTDGTIVITNSNKDSTRNFDLSNAPAIYDLKWKDTTDS